MYHNIMSLNFLYCFDDNYNYQAFSSICSVLDKTSQKLNIFIIHKDKNSTKFIPDYIKKHKMLKNIDVKKFKNVNNIFPNLDNVHVSEATYYRIYFDDYIFDDIENIIYLDSDIICNSDPSVLLKNYINELNDKNYVIGAVTHLTRNMENKDRFEDIKMKSSKYFNAGMILINVNRWKELNLREKLLDTLKRSEIKLTFWDQDLLNNVIDGQYLELSNVLNWSMKLYGSSEEDEVYANKNQPPIFFHLFGKQKPWVGKGLYSESSEIYQFQYRKHARNYYHIEHRWFPVSLKQLLISVITLKFFKIKYKLKFITIFFSGYISKKQKWLV